MSTFCILEIRYFARVPSGRFSVSCYILRRAIKPVLNVCSKFSVEFLISKTKKIVIYWLSRFAFNPLSARILMKIDYVNAPRV